MKVHKLTYTKLVKGSRVTKKTKDYYGRLRKQTVGNYSVFAQNLNLGANRGANRN